MFGPLGILLQRGHGLRWWSDLQHALAQQAQDDQQYEEDGGFDTGGQRVRRDQQRDRHQQHHDEQQAAKRRGAEEDGGPKIAAQHLADLDLGELDLLLDQTDGVFNRHPSQVDQAAPAISIRGSRAGRLRGRSPGSRIHGRPPTFLLNRS